MSAYNSLPEKDGACLHSFSRGHSRHPMSLRLALALVLSCSHALLLSCSPALLLSCYLALSSSSSPGNALLTSAFMPHSRRRHECLDELVLLLLVVILVDEFKIKELLQLVELLLDLIHRRSLT